MPKENEVPKLYNRDVRAIFESLYDNMPAPPGLKFQIVPVGPDGQGLSPPNHEYEDGIYVLLKPDKSKKKKRTKNSTADNSDLKSPKIPPHLAHLKMKTPLSNMTKWSLSGPQFPKPTAIQQRYCYPQGDSDYASQKGAALWTMYNCNGKEDKEYRLLHVYFSAKRANNTGRNAHSVAGNSKTSSVSSKVKKKRVNRKRAMPNAGKARKLQRIPRAPPPSSPKPKNDPIFRPSFVHVSPHTNSSSSGAIDRNLSRDGSFGSNFGAHKIYTIPSYILNGDDKSYEVNLALNGDVDDIFRESELHVPEVARHCDTAPEFDLPDPSSMMMTAASMEWSALGDTDTVDPMHDGAHLCKQSFEGFPNVLVGKLNAVHEKIIHEWIGSRPRSEQGLLVNVVANWARSVSRSPLKIVGPSTKENEGRDDIPGIGLLDSLMEDEDRAVAV